MKRRDFFINTILAGTALTISSCRIGTKAPKASALSEHQIPDFDLDETTVEALQQMMQAGTYSAVEITQKYMDRIRAIDQAGPQLKAVVEINPDALQIAEVLDQERKNGTLRGPLHGIPIIIKENIDSGDKMMTTAGSLALMGHRAQTDAFIVKQLRAAGLVLLGKANLSEWANFRSTRSSSGWSGRGGQTRNPYCLDRTPCGSSSGSAVSVSANLCPLAIGTETDGSIVCPSGINGIVGIKPTVGLWSRSGIIPISESQDTAGPMARTVEDAALLLQAIAAPDANDAVTTHQPPVLQTDLHLDEKGLNGARIGYLKQLATFDERVETIMKEAIQLLENQGAKVKILEQVEALDQIGEHEWTVLLYEFKAGINHYLKTHPEIPHQNLGDLITFNHQNAQKTMPWFNQEILEVAEQTTDLTDDKYKEALAKCRELSRERGIDQLLQKHQLDALIAPTNGPAWMIDYVNGDNFKGVAPHWQQYRVILVLRSRPVLLWDCP